MQVVRALASLPLRRAQADPEREFAMAAVLSECADTGLTLLLSLSCFGAPSLALPAAAAAAAAAAGGAGGAGAGRAAPAHATRLLLLKLLQLVAQLRKCRQHLLELGAVSQLVGRVHACMRSALALAGAAAAAAPAGAAWRRPEAVELEQRLQELQQLLALLEVLAGEAAAQVGVGRVGTGWAVGADTAGTAQQVRGGR